MSVVITVGATDAVGTKMVATTTATVSGTVPVCTPVNFTMPTAPAADTLVGNIVATNTPISFNIVSGNAGNFFEIWPTAHLRTAEATFGPIPPDGVYHLTVDATNAVGTGPAVPVVVTVGSAVAPTVVPVSITTGVKVTLGEVICVVGFTGGKPASWAITAGNPNGYYAISNSGVITVTAAGVSGLTQTTYSLTCQATNSFGTGSGMVTVILIPGGAVDPWINLDGRLNAPAGAPQFSALLNGYPTASPPNIRTRWPTNGTQPPWFVAGVDYAVGVPAGTVLTDWQSISLSGVTVNTGASTVTISGSNVTLNAIDFSLHGGATLDISNAASNAIISNCNMGYTGTNPTTLQPIQNQGSNTTIIYCTIDANGVNANSGNWGGGPSTIGCNQSTNGMVVKYCWIKNSPEDVFETGSTATATGLFVFKYNLIQDNGQRAGAHPDWTQLQSNGAASSMTFTIDFNTVLLTSASNGSDGWWLGTPGSAGPSAAQAIGTTDLGNNTMISNSASANVNNFIAIATASNVSGGAVNQVVGPVTVHDNFIDPTFSSGFARGGSFAAGISLFSNNINLTNGVPFTTTP